jgi:acetyl esterase/lipase
MRVRQIVVVLVAIVLLGGCEQLIVPNGAAPLRYRDDVFGSIVTTTDIEYGTAVTQTGATVSLRLDLRQPAGDPITKRPVIVFVHGGGFSGGNKTSPEIVDEASTFARKGYVTASISYRLVAGGCSAGAPTSSCVTAIGHARLDAQEAIRFLRAHASDYRIDKGRIAIAGTSAGAITALEVGFDSVETPSAAVRAAVSLSGAHLLTTPGKGDAGALLFHGTADGVVPYAWAENTIAAAKANGARAVLTSWKGDGHVPYAAHRTEILDQTRNFLYIHLDLAHAAGA